MLDADFVGILHLMLCLVFVQGELAHDAANAGVSTGPKDRPAGV